MSTRQQAEKIVALLNNNGPGFTVEEAGKYTSIIEEALHPAKGVDLTRSVEAEKHTALFTLSEGRARIEDRLEDLCDLVGGLNGTWWIDPVTGAAKDRNVGEMLMLVTSELSEALEGHRKSLSDDKLPQYQMFDVEIIDAIIRLFDIAHHLVESPGKIFVDKCMYNAKREDHSLAHRKTEHGKKY